MCTTYFPHKKHNLFTTIIHVQIIQIKLLQNFEEVDQRINQPFF
jgi:hypothetical protein